MINIGRDNHAANADFVAHLLRGQLLAPGYILHFFRDQASTGIVHLGEIAIGILCLAARQPFKPRLRNDCVPVAWSSGIFGTIAGGHNNTTLTGSFHEQSLYAGFWTQKAEDHLEHHPANEERMAGET